MLDSNCEPNIMILAQVVFEIFCSQACTDFTMGKSEKGDNSFIDLVSFTELEVIFTLDTIYEANIMILVQMVLKIFCSQTYLSSPRLCFFIVI